MALPPARLTGALAALLLGCPSAADPIDPGVRHAFPPGDVAEIEPNDGPDTATDLGVVAPSFAVTGDASGCGGGGTWDGADEDWLAFRPADAEPLRLVLDMRGGDLDVAVFGDEGDLAADGAEAGVDDESIAVALDPERTWLVRVRCWQGGDEPLWRLRFEEL